jgi:energy-converting hydrogenase Eha subunit H
MNTKMEKEVTGRISTSGRIARFATGFVALVILMQLSAEGSVTYVYPLLIATIVALSGIGDWNPLYAIKNKLFSSKGTAISKPKPAHSAA